MKNQKLIIAGLLTVVVAGGGSLAATKYKEVKSEKELLKIEQQQRLEEEKRLAEIEAKKELVATSKVAYLTFDDGPHHINTPKVLETLKNNNVKATFFIVGDMAEKNPELVKKIKENGHTLANHTTQHKYKYTAEAFLADVKDTDSKIAKALGEDSFKSDFVRVPGGSMGKKTEKSVLEENGYRDMNWTALNGDSEKGGRVSKEYILERIDKTIGDDQHEVVLMHDIKSVTAETLQEIIDKIKAEGYIFEPLTKDSTVQPK